MGSFAGLGDVMAGSTSREARRAASAFLRGKSAKTSCTVGGNRTCHFTSDGKALQVRGKHVAARSADAVKVCLNPGSSAEERGIANLVLRSLRAGVNAKRVGEGLRVGGRRGRARAEWPGCVTVRLTAAARKKAAKIAGASVLAPLPPAVDTTRKISSGAAKRSSLSTKLGKRGRKK